MFFEGFTLDHVAVPGGAAATIDLAHDRATRADGIKVRCPMLVLWGAKGKIGA